MRRSLVVLVLLLVTALAVPCTDAARFGSRKKKRSKDGSAPPAAAFELQSGLVGQLPEVREAMNWVERDQNNVRAWRNLGQVLAEVGDVKDAIAALEIAVEVNPDSVDAWVDLAAAFLRGDEPRRALDTLDEALEIEPFHARAHYNRGLANQALDRYDEALESFEAAFLLEPRLLDPAFNPGVVNVPDLDVVKLRIYLKTAGAAPSIFSPTK